MVWGNITIAQNHPNVVPSRPGWVMQATSIDPPVPFPAGLLLHLEGQRSPSSAIFNHCQSSIYTTIRSHFVAILKEATQQ